MGVKVENERIYANCKNYFKVESEKAARKYHQYEPHELVAEAWIRGLIVDNPKYLKKRIIFNIMDFIRHDMGIRVKYKKTYITNIIYRRSINGVVGDGPIWYDEQRWFTETCETEVEHQDFIEFIISFSKLARKELKYVRLMAKGYTVTDIAKKLRSNPLAVSAVLYSARKKMKKAIKENDINW